ncbi:MAG: hypothetical protein LBO62_01475, partial [Endomicrobium sp.]|nr:hypothetical protein [Endomicrobium sp.]
MKKNIALLAAALIFASQAAFAQEDVASAAGINISGGATIVLQGLAAKDNNRIDASYSYDLELSKE